MIFDITFKLYNINTIQFNSFLLALYILYKFNFFIHSEISQPCLYTKYMKGEDNGQ